MNDNPKNNMDNENLEGLRPYRPLSPQPGSSRHFESVEEINTIADNILNVIKRCLGSVNHTSIVNAIQRNLRSGNKKLSLQDLLLSDLNLESSRKRHNSEDISGVDMKKSRGNANPSSPVLAGFLAGNPVNISNFSTAPVDLKPQYSGNINNAAVSSDLSASIQILAKPQIATASSSVNNRVTLAGNNDVRLEELRRIKQELATERPQLDANAMVDLTKKGNVNYTSQESSSQQFTGMVINRPATIPLPVGLTPQNSGKFINAAVSPDSNTSIRIVTKPQISTASSSVDNRMTLVGNNHERLAELHRTKQELATERHQIDCNAMVDLTKNYNVKYTSQESSSQQFTGMVNNRPATIPLPPVLGFHVNGQVNVNGPIQVNNTLAPNNQAKPNLASWNTGKKVCEEIYRKLRAIFPDIDKEYIKVFCPEDWLPGMSHDVQFGSIVEKILVNKDNWVMDVNPTNCQAEVAEDEGLPPNVDDTYEYLAGIFPNADPHYLRSTAEQFKNKNDIKAFVDEKLNSNNYPTREQYFANIRITEERQRYTKNFNVEQFLSLFPDPFKHFEDDKRKFHHNWIVLEFLKSEFNRVRANTISLMYRRYSCNMSLAAKHLRLSTDFIVNARRSAKDFPTEDISLLQEMAFIRHHEEIRKHMETVKQKEEEEFNSLKAAGSLLACQCCYDDECMPSRCSTCDNAHVFCNSCVVKGTDTKLGDGETHVACFLNCGSEFSISTLQKVLPPTKFSILLKKRQAAEVMAAGLEGLVSCPFCHFASIPPEGDKVFKCLNPECMKESCIQCKEPNHVPFLCGEIKVKDMARKFVEEKMTQALTRVCYKCKTTFFKEEGCNKMKCPCGAMMCYICSEPVQSYEHFRGQGSTEMNKCPLWSDNIRLNAEIVRKVEEDARKQMLKENPTLDIDTTRLAPALPKPTRESHCDISETENLANVLAARVLNNNTSK